MFNENSNMLYITRPHLLKKKIHMHTHKKNTEIHQTFFKRNNCLRNRTGKKRAKDEAWIPVMVASASHWEGS